MNIEIKPCTVVVDGKTVASYDSAVSATAFRHGIEWARKQPLPLNDTMEKAVDAVLNKLRLNAIIDEWWNAIPAPERISIRSILIKAAIAATATGGA